MFLKVSNQKTMKTFEVIKPHDPIFPYLVPTVEFEAFRVTDPWMEERRREGE